MTEEGLLNAFIEVRRRLRIGGTRDEVSAMLGELRLLNSLRDMQKDRTLAANTTELLRELRETKRLLKSSKGGSTSFESAPALPRAERTEPH